MRLKPCFIIEDTFLNSWSSTLTFLFVWISFRFFFYLNSIRHVLKLKIFSPKTVSFLTFIHSHFSLAMLLFKLVEKEVEIYIYNPLRGRTVERNSSIHYYFHWIFPLFYFCSILPPVTVGDCNIAKPASSCKFSCSMRFVVDFERQKEGKERRGKEEKKSFEKHKWHNLISWKKRNWWKKETK